MLREEYYKERRRELEREAHWVCVLVNSIGKRKHTMKVHDLIGHSPEQVEAMRRAYEEKQRRIAAEDKREKERSGEDHR